MKVTAIILIKGISSITTESKGSDHDKRAEKENEKTRQKNKRIFFWMWIVMILVVSFSIARFAMVNINDMLAVGRDDSVVQIQIPKNATGEQVGELLAEKRYYL